MKDELPYSCLGFIHFTSWIDNSFLAVCKTNTNEDAICHIRRGDAGKHGLIVKYFHLFMSYSILSTLFLILNYD